MQTDFKPRLCCPITTANQYKQRRYFVELYTYDDPSKSSADEDLFATIDNKNRVAHTDMILPVPGNANNNNSTAYENGVREPTPDLTPKEIVPLIMNALKNNDTPKKDAGIKLVFGFATDTTQYVFKNNVTGE